MPWTLFGKLDLASQRLGEAVALTNCVGVK